MKTNYKQLFTGFIFLSVVLMAVVPMADFFTALFFEKTDNANNPVDYAGNEMAAGIASETIRALITVYLYATTQNRGRSLLHGITYGLLYSALIASLYIILGAFYFQLKNPLKFIVADTSILLVQGVLSGVVLYFTFRNKALHQDS